MKTLNFTIQELTFYVYLMVTLKRLRLSDRLLQIEKGRVCLSAHRKAITTSKTCSTEQAKKKDGVHYSLRQAKQSY